MTHVASDRQNNTMQGSADTRIPLPAGEAVKGLSSSGVVGGLVLLHQLSQHTLQATHGKVAQVECSAPVGRQWIHWQHSYHGKHSSAWSILAALPLLLSFGVDVGYL